ncbi:hypothetical protein BX666DRAFT_291079 [Dichotomocladium elegans]|nr:hypothetical protein BX666DRAFT_291079 [Dichotomocladium elegans]
MRVLRNKRIRHKGLDKIPPGLFIGQLRIAQKVSCRLDSPYFRFAPFQKCHINTTKSPNRRFPFLLKYTKDALCTSSTEGIMTYPAFEIIPLTPDNNSNYNSIDDSDDPLCNWMDDSECEENLFHIIPLMPEESIVDENNHIRTHVRLFFTELGYLTEEPEPIDPTRDYEAEAQAMLQERERTRRKHIQPSMASADALSYSYSQSNLSSGSSSLHHRHHPNVRSPCYIGYVGHPPSSLFPSSRISFT